MNPATREAPDRNLAMELVRTTEAAALAAARWMGRGDKIGADGAAVDAMRIVLQSVPMAGLVVIGEGEKDEAPMLYNGEEIGDGTGALTDIAVDPIDGTTLTARGRGGAISVIAVPLMLDHDADVPTAILTSLRAFATSPGPLLLWAALLVGLTLIGFAFRGPNWAWVWPWNEWHGEL